MYYSLPVKERMQLMKHYKTAYPGMSYNDMVEHFNNGGKLGDPPQSEGVQDINKFMQDYTNSEKFYNLSKGEGYTDEQIKSRRNEINSFDPTKHIKYTPSGNSWVHDKDSEGFRMTLSEDKGDWPSYKDINAHEFGHIGYDSGVNPVIESSRQKIMLPNKSYQNYKSGKVKMNENIEHDIEPQENRSDIFQLRYQLYNKGIYNSIKDGEFKKEHLDKFKQSGDWNRMQRLYKDEDIIKLMNSIADSGNKQNTGNIYQAKYGGIIQEYADGGEIGDDNRTPQQKYAPTPTLKLTPEEQKMAFTPMTQNEIGDWVKKHGSGRLEESLSPIDLLGPAEIKAAASMVKSGAKALPKVAKGVAEYTVNKNSKPFNKFALKNIDAIEGSVDLAKQIKGEILQGSKNRAAIKEGNDWLKSWIEHPATKAKIDKDATRMADVYKKTYEPHLEKYKNNPKMVKSLNNALEEDIDYLNALKIYAQEYNPRVSEYPLTKQFKDNLKQYINKGKENIHSNNLGVSYTHGYTLNDRAYIESYPKNYERYGNWMSRDSKIPYNDRVSTTIHEGTHDWVNDEMLKTFGLRNKTLKYLDNDVKQNFLTWENYRKVGKDPGKVMDSIDNYKGYLTNPTEQHARIMELRKHYNLKPDDIVTDKMGRDIMFDILDKKTPVDPYFANMFGKNADKKLASLFNNLWAVSPAVVGTAYLNKDK